MDGVHDMAGMHGFGPIPIEKDEPVFHQPWEGRVRVMTLATPVPFPGSVGLNTGVRYAIERMPPAEYLSAGYFERWLFARILGLIEAGVMTQAEYAALVEHFASHPDAEPPRRYDPEGAQRLAAKMRGSGWQELEDDRPRRFAVGDAVRPKNMHPAGHTRLPRYVRGKRGIITRCYSIQVIQDTLPPGVEAQPEPVYAVRFAGTELWGESAEPNSVVYVDMWESYLEPA